MTDLWGEPVALKNEDGILVCVSEEAVLYGLRPGQKSSGARALCANLRLLPYERAIYEQAAALIWDGIAVESSVVEPFSPEICFAELDDRHVTPRLRSFASELSAAARMPIQVGLATSKLVAKHAAHLADHTDPLIVFPGSEARLLADVEIESLQQIDAEMTRKMVKLGLRTLGDLQAVSYRDLHRAVGRTAMRLSRLAVGLDGDPVLPRWPKPSLTVEQGFGYEVTQLEPVYEGLQRCAKRLSRTLQVRREFTALITVRLIREDRSCLQMQERLPGPTQSMDGLYNAAVRIVNRMGTLHETLEAVGMSAAELSIATGMQLELMDLHGNQLPAETRKKIQVTLEYLRSRFGIGAVLSAASMHRARRIDFWVSPFCHQLNEPIEVVEAPDGRPLRFWRRQKLYLVNSILQDWCETCWSWNELVRSTIYRIETEPSGLFELRRLGKSWRLTGAQD